MWRLGFEVFEGEGRWRGSGREDGARVVQGGDKIGGYFGGEKSVQCWAVFRVRSVDIKGSVWTVVVRSWFLNKPISSFAFVEIRQLSPEV